MVGYLLGRLASGEFGRRAPALRIELVGLRPEYSRRGVGRALFPALLRWGGRHGASEIRTLSSWTRSDMLGWLAGLGFELAPNLVLESGVGDQQPVCRPRRPARHRGRRRPGHGSTSGATKATTRSAMRHGCDVRAMTAADLDAIVRIDRENTGRDRRDYLTARQAEAEQGPLDPRLAGRALRRHRGRLPDGARADLGDFGRTAPVAVIATLGVDPSYAHRGVGMR